MKYIVDLPKEYISGSALFGKILSIPIQINDGKNYNIPTSIKITPYTEPDRKPIEDEVWEFAGEFYNANREVETLFGCDLDDICKKYTYSEAKAKYEEWRKQKDEIHVGDEVFHNGAIKTVLCIYLGRLTLCDSNGHTYYVVRENENIKKTGRHFPEVEELLKKMGEQHGQN